MDLQLRDRVCLVTGSTAGIGLETARILAQEGATVVVSGRDGVRVEAARADAGAALGVVCDLASPDGPATLVAEVEDVLDRVDCLVNNVGTADPAIVRRAHGGRLGVDVAAERDELRPRDPGRAARDAGAAYGRIVNVSSTAGKRPSAGMPDYSVTKAAVLSLSDWWPTSMRRRASCSTPSARGRRCRRRGSARGGLAEQLAERTGKTREQVLDGGPRPAHWSHGRVLGDRSRGRLPLFRPRELRHRGGMERRRRHRPDHHLSSRRPWSRAGRRPALAVPGSDDRAVNRSSENKTGAPRPISPDGADGAVRRPSS